MRDAICILLSIALILFVGFVFGYSIASTEEFVAETELHACKGETWRLGMENDRLRQQIEDHAATHHDVMDGLMEGTGR